MKIDFVYTTLVGGLKSWQRQRFISKFTWRERARERGRERVSEWIHTHIGKLIARCNLVGTLIYFGFIECTYYIFWMSNKRRILCRFDFLSPPFYFMLSLLIENVVVVILRCLFMCPNNFWTAISHAKQCNAYNQTTRTAKQKK